MFHAPARPTLARFMSTIGVAIIGSLFTDYRAQVGVKWGKGPLAEKLPPAGATVGA